MTADVSCEVIQKEVPVAIVLNEQSGSPSMKYNVTSMFSCIPSFEISEVVCLVAWPLNESEVGVDLVLIETSLLFLHKFLVISMRTVSIT